MGQHGTELLKIFACAWFSGVSDLGVCRHLCGVDTNNRSDRRHFRRDLGLHGLYRPLVLYAFQNGKPCKERLFGTLRGVSYDLKIGLIDVDSHNFPNLCLMKLSAYHKAKGHTVEWWNAKGRYDLVYKSRVFTDTYSKTR